MKDATQQWLNFAEIDLRTCEKLLGDDLLTSVVAFHSQQVVEKCFKAIIEEQGL
jgi:HEPN domain-containing protein